MNDFESSNFLGRLIKALSAASKQAGHPTTDASSDKILKAAGDARILDARWHLGADDGAYLRSNVLPLQTAMSECDTTALSRTSTFGVDAAMKGGLLKAYADHIESKIDANLVSVDTATEFVFYLLSIEEVVEAAQVSLIAKAHREPLASQAVGLLSEYATAKKASTREAVVGVARRLPSVTKLIVEAVFDILAHADEVGTLIDAQVTRPMESLRKAQQEVKTRVDDPEDAQMQEFVRKLKADLPSIGDTTVAGTVETVRNSQQISTDPDGFLNPWMLAFKLAEAVGVFTPAAATVEPVIQEGGLERALALVSSVSLEQSVIAMLSLFSLYVATMIYRMQSTSTPAVEVVSNEVDVAAGGVVAESELAEQAALQRTLETEIMRRVVEEAEASAEQGLADAARAVEEAQQRATAAELQENAASRREASLRSTAKADKAAAIFAMRLRERQLSQRQERLLENFPKFLKLVQESNPALAKALERENVTSNPNIAESITEEETALYDYFGVPTPDLGLQKQSIAAAYAMFFDKKNEDVVGRVPISWMEAQQQTGSPLRDALYLEYAVARGLCTERAPHHPPDPNNVMLRYTLPSVVFPPGIETELAQIGVTTAATDARSTHYKQADFKSSTRERQDVSHTSTNRPSPSTPEPARPVRWAPVEKTISGWKLDRSKRATAVATAVVLEQVVDFYTDNASGNAKVADLQCAAFAKLLQLHSLHGIFREDGSLETLCAPTHDVGGRNTRLFASNPVVKDKGKVLYPINAGFAVCKPPTSLFDELRNTVAPIGAPFSETVPLERSELTQHLRAALTEDDPPVYIPNKATLHRGWLAYRGRGRKDVDPRVFPRSAAVLDIDVMTSIVHKAQKQLETIEALKTDLDNVKAELAKLEEVQKPSDSDPDVADEQARKRRRAVWDDAEREACISGDRLYAFVRQLSGNIGEQVDAICQIDEGQLIRQQQEKRTAQIRASERAAQEHTQLVRNVFSEVIKESGLTLGIVNDGKIGELKVVSNTLRKQLSELTEKGSRGEGFFSNAVQLEQLLAQGTGEMSLIELFGKLQQAGVALQQAALAPQAPGAGPSASLEFLSAPRNSLLVRYKPEALAAIRRAFDVFQGEMARHGGHGRKVSAYELIEGRDEALCSEFSALCGHMLVHSRMFSTSTAMYISAWPASANVTMLRISLQRLVDAACIYLDQTEQPAFSDDKGRETYFRMIPTRKMPVNERFSTFALMMNRGEQWR